MKTAGEGVAERVGLVPEQLDHLDAELERAKILLATISERLASVLREQAPSSVCENSDPTVMAPLADRIRGFVEGFSTISSVYESILERLEL